MKMMIKTIFGYLTADWYEKLTSWFVAIVIANAIAIFEGFWWDETYRIAYWTLFIAAGIDFLLPYRMRFLKLVIKLCGAAVVTIQLARMDWLIARPERWQEWVWWLQAHAAQLNPFIWVSIALLLLHVLFSVWTTTRTRMFGLIGVSLLILTIADSFTPIWLWDEVGMVVFVGLLWLVASHLSRLQREHPRSWRELLEYPFQLIMPIAFVLTVLMATGLNMPSLSPILQDPYTIWKESKGQTVQVFLGDKGNDPVTSDGNGNASSGYSRSDEALGGGFDFDYSPMMTVTTSHRSYWRGESKALYTGEGWEDSETARDEQVYAIQKGAELASLNEPPAAGTIEVNQIVTMIRKDSYPVLFSASPASTVNWIGSEDGVLPSGFVWLPESLELRLLNWPSRNRKYPETYSITSSVPVLDETALRETRAGWSGANSVRNAMYLQLPDTLPARVRELAEDVTKEAESDYDKARLLEEYLRLNYTYNNKPDISKLTGESVDFVDQFLFELQEGYCDYFSTSMAVMARSLGLPARWVKGFAPGVLPAGSFVTPEEYMEENLNPSGAGTYTVRNSDAHSWVEIYFEGFGWVPFEPTSGFSFPYTVAEEEAAPLPDADSSETTPAAPEAAPKTNHAELWAWISVSLIVVAGAAWAFVRRKQMIAYWLKLRHGSYTANDRIVLETQRLLRICKKRGLVRQEHETLREAVLRWSQAQKRLQGEFRFVLDGFEQAKYSKVSVTSEDAERFVHKVRALIDELK
ncbi:transglutaminase domain-containing protein [Paenibacillus sp. N4]|uniref:DUF4129 domain-containing transglutaminase family protein n=1 Tax=Paenibacillus vietnamensis TaxID=2590547 RepID=UPI001CD05AE5|nr:transglutaminase domain-containing protein [Paenibacillus vietnamensis]MCA0753657.1 transglutaminase domain-containing protein [Paenibacillus vietnamensis]